MTTPNDILAGAYGYSLKNNPGSIASEATELLDFVRRALVAAFTAGARINPAFYGASEAVAFAAPGWARPAAAESVFRIETPAAKEVVVVPLDDRLAEPGKPCVYQLGQVYRPARATAPDPQAGDLTVFYSRRPAAPADLDAALDAMWPTAYDSLLMLEVALYLAVKDGRTEEVPQLLSWRDQWARAYVLFLEHETVNERRRWSAIKRPSADALAAFYQPPSAREAA